MSAVPILHFDLLKPKRSLDLASAESLIVLWLGDWPLGQRYVGGCEGNFDVANIVLEIVDPDLLQRAQAGISAQELQEHSSDARIGVIICTRDRPDELARCLNSLSLQTRRPDQVVIVDNGSADGRTRRVADAAGTSYVREERVGLDFARNAGARAANTDFVAYADDDVVLHPRWLERLANALVDESMMAVTGLVLPAELETDAQQYFEKLWGFGRGYRCIDFGQEFFKADRTHGCPTWEIGAGANMAFRRTIFEHVGYFDERLDVGAAGCSGDLEFWHRILYHGFKCRYEPSAVVFHFHRRDFTGLSQQIYSYMRGHAAALLVQFERTGNWGNLRRAFITLPLWYTRRFLRVSWRGPRELDRFLFEEIQGFLSGILFYLTTIVRAEP